MPLVDQEIGRGDNFSDTGGKITQLITRGFSSVCVPNGIRILVVIEALAAGDEVDAIVCDVRMPELEGPDFYRSVRAKRSELGRRFVVTGNPASAIDPFFARKELLIKPVPAVEILAALARVLAA